MGRKSDGDRNRDLLVNHSASLLMPVEESLSGNAHVLHGCGPFILPASVASEMKQDLLRDRPSASLSNAGRNTDELRRYARDRNGSLPAPGTAGREGIACGRHVLAPPMESAKPRRAPL